MKKNILSVNELKSLEKMLKALTRDVGDLLLKKQKQIHKLSIHHKEAQGIATTADLAAERMILKRLKKETPDFKILSEENAFLNKIHNYQLFGEEELCWIIDPLDGTNNFVHGLDYFAISIGLVSYGEPLLGLVYRPSTEESFSALKAQGTFLQRNGDSRREKIQLKNSKKDLSGCLLATGFASEKGFTVEEEFRFFKKVLRNSRAVRRMGSAALDLCQLGVGRFDGFWEKGLAPWDVAAGTLIVKEAGGVMTDFRGHKVDVFGQTFLAAKKGVHKNLLKLVK